MMNMTHVGYLYLQSPEWFASWGEWMQDANGGLVKVDLIPTEGEWSAGNWFYFSTVYFYSLISSHEFYPSVNFGSE